MEKGRGKGRGREGSMGISASDCAGTNGKFSR